MSSDLTILGFGASTMQGVGDTEAGGFFKRLPALLPPRRFVNLGVGGHTTRDMLKRLELVETHQPFRAVVLLGCNDLPRDRDNHPANRTSIEEYATNLDTIFARLTGEGLFVSSFQPDPVRTGVAIATMDAYMAEAVRLAKRHGFEVWDLHTEIRQSPQLPDCWAADGMHFNPTGHAFLAERIAKLLA